jgi:hypothetical protein
VKVPEGFAFYTLYPEHYCEAARRWLADHGPREVLVVGVRSIGTTLSAVVAETLRAAGCPVRRRTVRPTGHPYDRRVELDPQDVAGARHALVVDEGPGRSGSSMAAVAEALVRAGLSADAVSFLPGHGGDPGPDAPEWSRAWWSHARRYVVPLDDLRWHGQSLTEVLASRATELMGALVTSIEDLSAGAWRAAAYPSPDEWPAVDLPFQRTRYRCTLADGTAVLWKFAGFSPLPPAREGLPVPEYLGTVLGFRAERWIDGVRLRREDATPAVFREIGRYIAAAAGSPLSPQELGAGLDRLREMLYWNTREALGEEAAERTRTLAVPLMAAVPRYGDGRLAPHEWVRDPAGRLWKTDHLPHDADHTVIGPQPVWWDLAGAIVEWELDPAGQEALLRAYAEAGGAAPPEEALWFYQPAYAAFRLGMAALCRASTSDADEKRRLDRAETFYRAHLTRLLP